MKTLTQEDLEPPPEIKQQIEKYRELYEAFVSLRGEDVSRLNFGPEFPKELTAQFMHAASEIQRAMRPIEQIHDAIKQQLEADAPPLGGPAAPVDNSNAPGGPPSVS